MFAWPTALLALVSVLMWAATHWWLIVRSGLVVVGEPGPFGIPSGLRFADGVGWLDARYLAAIAALAVSAYAAFTPMHDASHASIARGKRMLWLNAAIGHLSGLPLAAPFDLFRYLHLQHHKYTNIAPHDPDLWVSGGATGYSQLTAFLLPFRCLTIVWVGYVGHYAAAVPTRPPREALSGVGFLALFKFLPLLSPLVLPSYASYLLWGFLLPTEIAAAFLGLAFDYLPHRPSADARLHHATSVISLIEERNPLDETPSRAFKIGTAALTPFLLYQNYHLVHHLYPYLPFYHYSRVYWRLRVALNKRGHAARTLFPLVVFRDEERHPRPRFH